MNSVIVALISCGLCHSFSGTANSILTTDEEAYHFWSHHGWDNDANTITDQAIYNSLVSQNSCILKDMCLDLAVKLDSLKPDGVHSLLDQSLIVTLQEHNKRGHESWNIPAIMFGSANGALKPGQYIDLRDFDHGRDDMVYSRIGFPMNQLWANLLQAMDVPPSEYEALNKAGFANPWFTLAGRLTGYGCTTGAPAGEDTISDRYSSGWNGSDLSAWIPFLTPTS